jgi:D-3-phosphoglycerate dehydrogenase
LQGEPLPEWVPAAFRREGIDFFQRECTTGEELEKYAGDADLVWVWGSCVVTADRLDVLRKCGAILRSGSGTDNVPVTEATQRNILVANTPQAVCHEVSDHSIALLLAIVRQTAAQDALMRRGVWEARKHRTRWHLRGSTLGLVGFGHIGRMVARKMSGFEMHVLAHDPFLAADEIAAAGVQAVAFDELLGQSDFISLHTPLTAQTRHLIDERALRKMKSNAVLINTSRGAVVDESALVRALVEGWIGAAGLDVFEREPIRPDHPLLSLDNVVVTPHSAGYSDLFSDRFWRYSVETVVAIANRYWPRSPLNRGISPRWPLAESEWSLEPTRCEL